MTKPEAERHAHAEMQDRAERFVQCAHLQEFGMSPEAVVMAVDLLASALMQAWHEGAIAALDQALDLNHNAFDKISGAYDRLMAKVG